MAFLYRHEPHGEFIERISTRGANKPARALLDGQARLSFIHRVAWWGWTGPGTRFSLADQRPPESRPSGMSFCSL